jgi:hypothetical protein
MSSVIYAIVFNGKVLEGHKIISVKAHLAKLLKADADQILKLFSGKQVVIKKTPDKAIALKYGTALKKVGADVRVRVIKSDAAATRKPRKAAPRSSPRPAKKAAGLSLAPNVGNIFDAVPETPSPDIDLSDLSMAEAGEGTLGEPVETITLDLDLSGLNLSEPGEGTLAEPHEEVPRLDAPDFGLDEPGAVLETIHEEVELLNPDTSRMSMAEAGADLLPEEEKQPEPKPRAPDISKIQLVSNVDS